MILRNTECLGYENEIHSSLTRNETRNPIFFK